MSLTNEIVDTFIIEHLGIPDYETLIQKNKLEFLKLLVKSHNLNIYFQNADMASVPVKDRHVPTIQESIQRAFTGVGGNCVPLNYFMKILLVHLGYDAFSIAATMSGTPTPGNHMMTVIRFSENELYLVDVACGNPLLEPVPLHALPFRGPTAGDFLFEFRKISETHYGRFQIGGSLFHGAFNADTKEVPRFEFDLTPLEYEQFLPAMNQIWTDETVSPFYRNLFLFRYFYDKPGNENESIKDVQVALNNPDEPKFVLIYGYNFLIGRKGFREVARFANYADMIPVINKYFPKLNPDHLQEAIAFLEKHSQFEPRLMD